ncbi:alpha-amylase family glycosyl hydrolase [Streptomyces sp. NPDC001978]|uniref:alpha-amylase family glycosyl hydrolase n=1 Tax=Streptomyces sp. NPDC001978 TaxID=3364627 RepID=UPI00367DC41E
MHRWGLSRPGGRFRKRGKGGLVTRENPAWWLTAVVYCVNVKTYQDSDGDGIGDLPGLTSRLDYISELGVNCLWLQPLFPSPWHDDGYDISDYTSIDPRLGTLSDFDELIRAAAGRGIRILLDMTVNHTSTAHTWFQQARSDPASPYREWYVFERRRPGWPQHLEFPEESSENWTWDDHARAYYLHRYYPAQADLRFAHPPVRQALLAAMRFWLSRGVAGFRWDTVPWLIETSQALGAVGDPWEWFADLCDDVRREHGEAVLLLGEVNGKADDQIRYFGVGRRLLDMLINFDLNRTTWLALARRHPGPLYTALARLRRPLPDSQWANFLRNHDELNIDGLTEAERADFFERFPPDGDGPIYGRGIRRRVPPLLGTRRRVQSAYSLLFALPGTPMLLYGEEIGMGDNLALPMRFSVRTPMQWTSGHNAGFSNAPVGQLVRPLVTDPKYAHAAINVADQARDPDSLLRWFQRLIAVRHACPELGIGEYQPLPGLASGVLAFSVWSGGRAVLCLHNLADTPAKVTLDEPMQEVWSDQPYPPARSARTWLLAGDGYRWLRAL